MTIDPISHRRKIIRLPEYDYSQPGGYYVTIVTHDRRPLFGEISSGEMRLNENGKIVAKIWHDLVHHIPNIKLDGYVIMPNHFHGIVFILERDYLTNPYASLKSNFPNLPEIIRQFKTFSSRTINSTRKTPGVSIWQRNYFERVIRNEDDLNQIRKYIIENPQKWELDKYFNS